MNKDYFEYQDKVEGMPENAFRISASQLSRFFDETSKWYHEMLLGEEGFAGSTASELGNVVHAAAAMYAETKDVDREALSRYILSLAGKQDVETDVIREQYTPMIEALINQYLSRNVPTHCEEFIWNEVLPGIVVGGSCDAYDATTGTIIDYKTTSSKTPPKSFYRPYWFQLMTYAWVYKQMGRPVNKLKLVYVTRNETGRISEVTGKPMKDYPSSVYTLEHKVTSEDLDIINGCIQVIAHSVQAWNEQPELRHLLAQDWRLFEKPKPKLFKD
jgi:hypothetical protein